MIRSDSDRLDQASSFWDDQHLSQERGDANWMAKPAVRDYINNAIGEGEPLWPIHWLRSKYPNGFRRALSIGCGSGNFEHGLIEWNVCEAVDAFDGAIYSLHTANERARASGWANRLHFFAADFNRPALPRAKYDVVFFNQSLHHVARLERLFAAVMRTLKPDGIIFLDEYVGPSRHEWTPRLLAFQQAVYALLPKEWRRVPRLSPPVELADPSEAIRSSEIVRQLGVGYDVIARRDYGGTLLSVIVPLIDWTVAPESFITNLIAAEQEWQRAMGGPYYTIMTAQPKRGARRWVAKVRYFIEPKARAFRVHTARIFGKTVRY